MPVHHAVSTQTAASVSAWRSPWVIGWIVMVVIVFAINAVMVYLAFATNAGLVNANYYDRAQHYEETMLSRRARGANWVLTADVPESLAQLRPATIRLFVTDRAGQPMTPDRVVLYAYRPADAGQDFSVPMQLEAAGRYAATVAFPLKGVWDFLAAVTHGEDEFSVGGRVQVASR